MFPTVAVSRIIAEDFAWQSTVILNGFDEQVFFSDSRERRQGVVAVGRMVRDKGFDLLISAFAMIQNDMNPDAKLTLIGDGPERRSLEEQAERLGVPVHFTGTLKPAEIAEQLRDHHVAAVPSRWREPFGLVGLEAAACGCVTLVPDETGLTEAVGPAGIHFRRNDARDLARALRRAQSMVVDKEALDAHLAGLTIDRQVSAYEATLIDLAHGKFKTSVSLPRLPPLADTT
ncbi:glycosyltransferase family 4 protein [Kineosporia rhizophila]|uniref:glycosyltransferase family 4 protein n=1 Tax=Kineosporia rhizophila TaxID=84633 RepID=UPI001E2E34C7|nr:glycosyltransferase family 4 protein [Kineosporia rhizophila]MCE0537755.1 glycosyltransferase family 4 protein [Kineosporia rhizophila]